MRTFYFVRHGQTQWNAIRRMQGQHNSDLNALGRRQADDHGRLLARLDIDSLYASPLDRTVQTVEIIQGHMTIDAQYDERIKEWDCGEWSGHLYEDIKARWPIEWEALEADRFHYRGPKCENYPDMIARARPFLDDVLATRAKNIAVVSHGMIGRVMVGLLMGFGEDEMLAFSQPNDIVYRVRRPADDTAGNGAELHHFEAGIGPKAGTIPRR